MKILIDHEGRAIRLTDERLAHILEHPEMQGMEGRIEETVRHLQIRHRHDANWSWW